MRLYTCDRCGKKITENKINRIGILKGDIDLMSFLGDNPKIESLLEVIVSFLDPNSKIYCDDCINSAKQFIDSTAVVRVNSSKDETKVKAKLDDNVKPAAAKSVEKKEEPKSFTFKMVGEPKIQFSEPKVSFDELNLEDFAKKLFGF